MKLVCDRGALLAALNLAGPVAAARTTKPILNCLKLEAAGGTLTITATDAEVAIRLQVGQVQVQTEGGAVLPADKITAIVRESTEPTITIECEGSAAHLRSADSHFKIFGHAMEDFPPVGAFEGKGDFQIEAGLLNSLITRTLFATARETSRYAINGVLLERQEKKLTLVATDGRRLALAKSSCSDTKGKAVTCIVPSKGLANLQKLLAGDSGEMVRVKSADNQIQFATEMGLLTSHLVEGNFPPYQDVVPKDHDRKAVFNTTALASAVRRSGLLTNEESRGVRFAFAENRLVLSSRAPEAGEAEVTVSMESYTGEPLEIGFNPTFVVDVLKVVGAEKVTLELKAANKPGILRGGNDFLYVLMPVSLT